MLRTYRGAEVSLLWLYVWLMLLSLESAMTFLEEGQVSCLHSLVKIAHESEGTSSVYEVDSMTLMYITQKLTSTHYGHTSLVML